MAEEIGPEWAEADGWPFEGDDAMAYMEFVVRASSDAVWAGHHIQAALAAAGVIDERGLVPVNSSERAVVASALLDSVLNGTTYGYGRRLRSDESGSDGDGPDEGGLDGGGLDGDGSDGGGLDGGGSDGDGPEVSDDEVYARWVESLRFPGADKLAMMAVHALTSVLSRRSELAQSRDEVWRRRVEELRARLHP
ncbi:MAG: hypothetical protein LBK54_11150 [Propionibacteriaceae bacterium]|jgi:hypothetical protein|nr:hypothetical protein [Propionibacteriaceae bacterium]